MKNKARTAKVRALKRGGPLETNAHADFDVSRLCLAVDSHAIVRRCVIPESAEAARVVQTEVVIGPLIMIQNVGEDAVEFQVHAFGHADALLDAKIRVPIRHPPKIPEPPSRLSIPRIGLRQFEA